MNYYLVKAKIKKYVYMGEESYFDDIRLVKADDAISASNKYENYWTITQSSLYSISYQIIDMDVIETIE